MFFVFFFCAKSHAERCMRTCSHAITAAYALHGGGIFVYGDIELTRPLADLARGACIFLHTDAVY